MRHLCDDATSCGRVGPRNYLIELGDAKAPNNILLILRVTDHAPIILDLDLAAFYICLLCHNRQFFEFVELSSLLSVYLFLNELNKLLH